MKLSGALFLAVVLGACALPPDAVDTAGFVQSKELQGVGLVREALVDIKQSRFVDAELLLRQALYLFPDADNIKENLALALSGGDQIEEAEVILRALAAKYPKASRHRVNLAETYYRAHRYDEAREVFMGALDLALARSDMAAAATILRSLSVLELRAGNEEAALCKSREAFTVKSDAPEAIRHARILLAAHRYPEVLSSLFTFNNPAPELVPDINRLNALASYAQGQYESASSYVQKVLDSVTGEFESRDEVELISYLAQRRQNNTIGEPPTSDELEKNSILTQQPSEFQRLYWPENFLADYYAQQELALANQ